MHNGFWAVFGPVFLGTICLVASAAVVRFARRREAMYVREGGCVSCGRELAAEQVARVCAKCVRSLQRGRAMLNVMLVLAAVGLAEFVWIMVMERQAGNRVQWEHTAFLVQVAVGLWIIRRGFEIPLIEGGPLESRGSKEV